MAHFIRAAVSMLVVSGSILLAIGCGSESGGGDGGGGNTGNGSTGNGNTTASGTTCEVKCSAGSDCSSIACACSDGSTVNTSSCFNGCCAAEEDACPDSCKDHGGWGSSDPNMTSSGTGGSKKDFGDDCSDNAECSSNICFFVDVNDESVKKCTKNCDFGTGECGAGWDCASVQDGAMQVCILQ